MTILLGVIGAFAVMALVIAVIQAAQIVRLAPSSERLGSYFALGWWKFGQLEAKAGPASVPHLEIYKRSVIAFIVFVLLGLVLSGWAASQTPAASPVAALNPSTPTNVAAIPDLRRVATMPGTPTVES